MKSWFYSIYLYLYINFGINLFMLNCGIERCPGRRRRISSDADIRCYHCMARVLNPHRSRLRKTTAWRYKDNPYRPSWSVLMLHGMRCHMVISRQRRAVSGEHRTSITKSIAQVNIKIWAKNSLEENLSSYAGRTNHYWTKIGWSWAYRAWGSRWFSRGGRQNLFNVHLIDFI